MSEKNQPMDIHAIINKINSKYKTEVISIASKAKSLKGIRISTGIFSLDIALGGGWMKGRIGVIKGEFSTGKTFVVTKSIASYQRHCRHCNQPFNHITQRVVNVDTGEVVKEGEYGFHDRIYSYKPTDEELEAGYEFEAEYHYEGCGCDNPAPHQCVFIDAEGAFHPGWAEDQGVIIDELKLVQTEFAEQAIDITEALARTGQIDFLAVDSVPALTPSKEIEDSAEDSIVGAHARLMNRFMRVLQSAINSLGMDTENKPTILLINQLRQKVGIMFGNPETSPGGKGIDYAASYIVRMGATQRIKIDPETGKVSEKGKIPVGVVCNFTIPKNKTYPPFQEGTFKIDTENMPEFGYQKGRVNNEEQIIKYAGDYGIVHVGGGGSYSYTSESGQEIKGKGIPDFTKKIIEAGLFDEIAQRTKAIAAGRALK